MNDIINYFDLTAEQVERLTDQQRMILLYIYAFGSISPYEAFVHLKITKLATRISEMISKGIGFDKVFESRHEDGKTVRYMRYRRSVA